jgi:hypothetical protein
VFPVKWRPNNACLTVTVQAILGLRCAACRATRPAAKHQLFNSVRTIHAPCRLVSTFSTRFKGKASCVR